MNIVRNLTPQHRLHLGWLAGLLVVDGVIFAGTDAHQVAVWLLIVGFGLAVLTVYRLVYFGLAFLRLYGLVIKRRRRAAATLTGVIALLLALQSAGGLSPKDVLLLLPLVVIGYNYVSYGLDHQV